MLCLGYKLRTKSDIFVIDKQNERKPRAYAMLSSQIREWLRNYAPRGFIRPTGGHRHRQNQNLRDLLRA